MKKAKPIIATALKGLFISSEPWDNAHLGWYVDRERELKERKLDTSVVREWRRELKEKPESEKKTYFKYVDRIMGLLYPALSDEERTGKARELFFESTVKYIKQHPEVVNRNVKDYFRTLKRKYRIALITTNTQKAVNNILRISGLEGLFDIVEVSLPKEKDDKIAVFDRFISKYDKPMLYIGSGRADSYDYCNQYNIPAIFANLEGLENIPGVEVVHSLKQIKERIFNIN